MAGYEGKSINRVIHVYPLFRHGGCQTRIEDNKKKWK